MEANIRWKIHNAPMNQHTAIAGQATPYKRIGGGEMLHDVFILEVIEFDRQMLVLGAQVFIERPAKSRDDVRDVAVGERRFALHANESAISSS